MTKVSRFVFSWFYQAWEVNIVVCLKLAINKTPMDSEGFILHVEVFLQGHFFVTAPPKSLLLYFLFHFFGYHLSPGWLQKGI